MIPTPTDIKLLQKSRVVEITFSDGKQFTLSCAYLRAHSPSAEAKLSSPNEKVNIIRIEIVGNYAVKFIFDDNHDSGIYSFDYLYQIASTTTAI
jgi:DUF971 family protein